MQVERVIRNLQVRKIADDAEKEVCRLCQVRVGLLELLDEVRELRDRVLHAHVLVRRPRAQPYRGLGLPDGCNDGVHDLETEPGAVLDGASVLVGAVIGGSGEELLN